MTTKYLVLSGDQSWDSTAWDGGWVGKLLPYAIFGSMEQAERDLGVTFVNARAELPAGPDKRTLYVIHAVLDRSEYA